MPKVSVVNKLFKRHLLENLKMDELVSLGEDLMVSAQAMAKAKKITILEKDSIISGKF